MSEIEHGGDPLADEIDKIFEGQDDNVVETGHGIKFDGFLHRYNLLPEIELRELMGRDMVIERTSKDGTNMQLRPIAQYRKSLVVEDIGGVRGGRDVPSYLFIYGSILFDENEITNCNKGELDEIASFAAKNGDRIRSSATTDTITDLGVIYTPGSLCRDAHIITSRAYTFEEMRGATMRGKTAHRPLSGSVITVQRGDGRKLTLFVEDDITRGIQIKNVYSRDDNVYHPKLSYI